MKTLSHKHGKAVIGLEWLLLSNKKSEKRAIKDVLEQDNYRTVKNGMVIKFGGTSMIGLVPVEDKMPKHPSAAAMVALANQALIEGSSATGSSEETSSGLQDWILIEPLGEGQYWFLVIKEGLPLSGTDIIIDHEAAVAVLAEQMTGPMVVFSSDRDIREEAVSAVRVEDKSFADLVESIKPSRAKVKPLKGVPRGLVLGLVVVILALAAWWGWSTWQQKQAMASAQAAAAQAAIAQEENLRRDKAQYNADIRTAVLAALETSMGKVERALATPSMPDAIQAWLDLVESTSIDHAGWDLSGFACSIEDAAPVCDISLTRGPYGINRLLFEDHPDADLQGDQATYRVVGPPMATRSTPPRSLSGARVFNDRFVSDLQMLKFASVNFALGESQEITEPVSMPEKPATLFKPGSTTEVAQMAVSVKTGISTGSLTLSADKLWQLRGLKPMVGYPELVPQATTIQASRSTTGSWTLQAEYFIRTNPQPSLPSVLGADDLPVEVELPEQYRATPEELAAARDGQMGSSASAEPSAPAAAGQAGEGDEASPTTAGDPSSPFDPDGLTPIRSAPETEDQPSGPASSQPAPSPPGVEGEGPGA